MPPPKRRWEASTAPKPKRQRKAVYEKAPASNSSQPPSSDIFLSCSPLDPSNFEGIDLLQFPFTTWPGSFAESGPSCAVNLPSREELQSPYSVESPASATSSHSTNPLSGNIDVADKAPKREQRSHSTWSTLSNVTTLPTAGDDHRDFNSPGASSQERSSGILCLAPKCEQDFVSQNDLMEHIRLCHEYTCSWAGCSGRSFSSREELAWHVNTDHLLVCPAKSCDGASFPSAQILSRHIEVSHRDRAVPLRPQPVPNQIAQNPPARPTAPSQRLLQEPASGFITSTRRPEPIDDPGLKETLSIVTKKRKCQEQLRLVLERRARKLSAQAAGMPRSAASPGDSSERFSRLAESAPFHIVWEHGVLPFLVEFIPKWCGPGHTISVLRGRAPDTREIHIMTKTKCDVDKQTIISFHIKDLLPETFRRTSPVHFSTGEISRLVWARGLGPSTPDDVCPPRNPFHYRDPCMGDSIGITLGGDRGEERSATLGPCLMIGGASFWLTNIHPFIEAYQSMTDVTIQHPSPADQRICRERDHDALSHDSQCNLGTLCAASGFDLETTRISHEPYWVDCDKEPPLVVTDWALVASQSSKANLLRRFPMEDMPLAKNIPVRWIAPINPGARVFTTGRTSGFQLGQICLIPTYVSGDEYGNGTGRGTREWFIEELCSDDSDDDWIRGGIGVPGDSGAAVVDSDTNGLLGQVWGRNKYWGEGRRIVYFTPIGDILDDVQEKCREQSRGKLPLYRDEDDRYPVYPSCRQCYDMCMYLENRRSSGGSVPSMMTTKLTDREGDVFSVDAASELATPNDQPVTHPILLRHMGSDDIRSGSSSQTMASPTAMAMLSPYNTMQYGTDLGVKSPYVPMLSHDDFYDPLTRDGSASGKTGKRPATMISAGSSSSVQKRQRTNDASQAAWGRPGGNG